jgi:hypothetical protein
MSAGASTSSRSRAATMPSAAGLAPTASSARVASSSIVGETWPTLNGSGDGNRTRSLLLMRQASDRCSSPQPKCTATVYYNGNGPVFCLRCDRLMYRTDSPYAEWRHREQGEDTMPTDNNKPSSVAETLERAKAVIDSPEHWAKGTLASRRAGRNADAFECDVAAPEAVAWCALGALAHVDGRFEWTATCVLGEVILSNQRIKWDEKPLTPESAVWRFNDARGRRHADVMRAYDRAIERARREGL